MGQRILERAHRLHLLVRQGGVETGLQGAEGVLVAAQGGEVEVDELEHRLEVLRSRAAGQHLAGGGDARIHADLLAGEGLGQVGRAEVADAADTVDIVDGVEVDGLVGRVEGSTAVAEGAQHDLVRLEVGGLDEDIDAVGEGQLAVAELRRLGADDGAALRELGEERFVGDGVLILGDVLRLDGAQPGGNFRLGRGAQAFLVRKHADDHEVALLAQQLGDDLVHDLDRDARSELVGEHIGVLDAGDGLVVDEVAHVLRAVGDALGLLAFVVSVLDLGQVLLAGTVVFGGGEAVAGDAEHLAVDGRKALLEPAFRRHGDAHHGALGLGDEEVIVLDRGLHERRLRLHHQLVEALADHHVHHADGIVHDQVVQVALHLVRIGLVLLEDIGHRVRLFLVLHDGDDRLGVVLHGNIVALRRVHRLRDGPEDVLDLRLDRVDVDVADDHDTLLVRTVPLLIVVAERLVREVVHDLHQADGHTDRVLVVRVDDRQELLVHTHLGVLAAAPLLVDHAALLVDVFPREEQAVGPVVEDPEAGVDRTRNGHGDVVDVIDGLVDRSIGVQVRAELHTDGLEVLDHAVAGEMLGPVEAHVLQEMGEAALVLVFKDGTDLLGDVEMRLVLRLLVVADVIGQSVLQMADADIRIDRNRRHLLGRYGHGQPEGQRDDGNHSFDHSSL